MMQPILGHTFSRSELCERALTHKSFAPGSDENNEILELLGDAVLSLIIVELLMTRYPRDGEGAISKKRASLVNTEVLAEVALEQSIHTQFRLGRGEQRSGGATKPRLLASTLEAVLGAIYLDAGLESARKAISDIFLDRIESLDGATVDYAKDYKSRLQEYAQQRSLGIPEYRLVSSEGPDHQKIFRVSVLVNGTEYGPGSGNTKKVAERAAAQMALESLEKDMSYRTGYAVLIGEPNVGKSTLANAIIGEQIAIVSPKPQTTRQRADGIITTPEYQLILLDSPGWVERVDGINQFLQGEFTDTLNTSDVVILCLGPYSTLERTLQLLVRIRKMGKPVVIVALQAERESWVRESALLKSLMELDIEVTSLSVRLNPEMAKATVLAKALKFLPEAEGPLYNDDIYTTQSLRQLSSELIREQCFLQLDDEVPYGVAVQVRAFEEDLVNRKGRQMTRIAADLVVERESHRPITIGAGGQRIKAIGQNARKKIEKLIGSKVFLELYVRVQDGWPHERRMRKELGYEQQAK